MPKKFKMTYESTERHEDFIFDIKSISTLLSNWCATEGEIDDVALFLTLSLEKRINEFEKNTF